MTGGKTHDPNDGGNLIQPILGGRKTDKDTIGQWTMTWVTLAVSCAPHVEKERQTKRKSAELGHHFIHGVGGGEECRYQKYQWCGMQGRRDTGGNPGFCECSCCDYTPPLCGPESGHTGQGRFDQGTECSKLQGTLRQRKIVRGTPWMTRHPQGISLSYLFSQGN